MTLEGNVNKDRERSVRNKRQKKKRRKKKNQESKNTCEEVGKGCTRRDERGRKGPSGQSLKRI